VSVLKPKSFDGTDISATSANFPSGFPSDGLAQTPAKWQQRVQRVAGFWPRPLAPQPQERQFSLTVLIQGTVTDAAVQALKAVFSPRKGECTLVATDGTIDWQMSASVLDVRHEAGDMSSWLVTLQATYGLWKRTTDSIVTAAISAATTATLSAPNSGNERAPLVLEATPTAVKGTGNDQRYGQELVLAWRAARGASNYPIAIQMNTAAEVTASRMQADGDDLRVLVDGQEVDRWLGDMNTALSNVWIVLDFAPKTSGLLKSAITNVSPATGGTLRLVDGSQLPKSGVGLVDTEAIAWTSKSQDGNTLQGITRGVRSTTAASHSANAELFLVEHQIDVVYGYTAATAPVTDDTRKPAIELTVADSDNAKWTHDAVFATKAGTRPAEWLPTLLGTNTGLVAIRGAYGAETTYVPTSDGHIADGVPIGAATNWQAADDTPGTPDNDTTYIRYAAGSGGKVTLFPVSMAAPPEGSLISLHLVAYVRTLAVSGTPQYTCILYMSDGSLPASTFLGNMGTSYSPPDEWFWDTDPVAGVGWSPHGLATVVEFGMWFQGTFPNEYRMTSIYLGVRAVQDDDPGAAIGVYYAPGGSASGHDNQDAWMLSTPCGVLGANAIQATIANGAPTVSGTLQFEVVGVDERGRTVVVYKPVASAFTTVPNPINATPNGPLYQVGFFATYTTGTVALKGFAVTKSVLTFDPAQTPKSVLGARRDIYIHRWSLTDPATGQTITVLFPSALNQKLTIDADTGAVSYALAGYTPLPALTFDAPRLAWLELAAGANSLQWADSSNGSGALTLAAKWRDRRS
jgi:hypothetical protein